MFPVKGQANFKAMAGQLSGMKKPSMVDALNTPVGKQLGPLNVPTTGPKDATRHLKHAKMHQLQAQMHDAHLKAFRRSAEIHNIQKADHKILAQSHMALAKGMK